MAAEIYSATVRPATVFSLEKKLGGKTPLDAATVALLNAVTTANTVSDVLDIISECVKDGHVVAANQIGLATSVLT